MTSDTSSGPQMKALQCPNCAAPMRWKGQAEVIECRYCKAHVVAQSGTTTKAAAQAVTARKPKDQAAVVSCALAIPLLLAIVIGVAGYYATGGSLTSLGGVAPKDIRKVDLAATPDELAMQLGVRKAGDSHVRVRLSDSPFSAINFNWDGDAPGHVSSIGLDGPGNDPVPKKVLERLRKQLGRHLRPKDDGGYFFQASDAHISVTHNIYLSARGFEDDRWKQRMAALWQAVSHAALGAKDKLDKKTLRGVLNVDNSLAALAQLDVDAPVKGSREAVTQLFPGADISGPSYTVGLGHPWLDRARLNWENQTAAPLSYANFYFGNDFDGTAKRDEVVACFTPLLGEPEERVADHLKDARSYNWVAKDGMPNVLFNVSLFTIYLGNEGETRATKAGWGKVLAAVDKCGR